MGRFFDDSGNENVLIHYGRKGMKWGKHVFGKDMAKDVEAMNNSSKAEKEKFRQDWMNQIYDDYNQANDGKLRVYGQVMEPEFVQDATNKYLKGDKNLTPKEQLAVFAFVSILVKSGKLKLPK